MPQKYKPDFTQFLNALRDRPHFGTSYIKPEWIRLPGFGDRCPWTGLTRTQMDHLVRKQEWNRFDPPVESRILRIDGGEGRRGTRLILYSSLLEYLSKLPNEDKPKRRRARKQEAVA
jgi:hypothetical protein